MSGSKSSSDKLQRMTQRLKAPDFDDRLLPPGEVIADRFKLGEKIGEGPFGHVYAAEDTLVEADVAIKVFDDDVVDTPVQEEQFLKTTRRARALTQKNVVRLHDSGVHGDHLWVSMQRLEGLHLRKVARLRWQRDESFGLQEMEPIISQITLALQHVGRDHPHGNLKPENILFLPDLLKVTDSYVLASLPRRSFIERTGDSDFIAPELADEDVEPDVRCDVYSVGAIIGFLLFGEDYEPGAEPDAPGGLAAVNTLCERAMSEDPSLRYATVEALSEDFTSVVDTGSLLERRPAPPAVASAPPAPDTTAEPAPEPAADVEEDDAEPIDPLHMETPSDIGMPLEEDLETSEFDRQQARELGDYLPTNEVDREQLETREVSRDDLIGSDEPPAQPVPTDDQSEPEPPSIDTRPPARLADDEPDQDSEDEPPEGAPKPTADEETRAETPVRAIAAAAVVAAVFIGVILIAIGDDDVEEPQPDPDPQPQEVAEQQQQEQPDEVAEQPQEDDDEFEELRDAFAAASAPAFDAQDRALASAEERYEELEEEQDDDDDADEVAAAGSEPAGAAAQPSGAAPGPGDCPSGMVRVAVGGDHVCIDAYQHPGRGRMPDVNVSWFDANRLCGQQDKRLCSIDEWQAACGSGYPYGAAFDPDRCNTADADGFDRSLAETGSFPQCRSPSGAYDMSGNVHEWVEEQRVVGGAFDSGEDTATCHYSSAMSPGTDRPNVGFRCCKDPS